MSNISLGMMLIVPQVHVLTVMWLLLNFGK